MTAAVSAGERALARALARFAHDPLGFVRFAFAWNQGELAGAEGPDRWQADLLAELGRASRAQAGATPAVDESSGTGERGMGTGAGVGAGIRFAVASGHGVGKTALVAWLVLWFLSTRPHPQVVVTANTAAQLNAKTWRELAKWHRLAVNRHWFDWTATRFALRRRPQTWFAAAVPWSKERPEAFAGTHERHVLVIYDEASGIDDGIWDVSEGAMATPGAMWLAFGNPTRSEGRFADCFGRFRHRWRCRHVDAAQAARADRSQIARWIEDYGEDSDFVRVRVRGVFPRVSASRFIPREAVREAQGRATPDLPGPMVMGVDVARFGDDRSAVAIRQGRRLREVVRSHGLDTMQLAARVSEMVALWRPRTLFVDGVGVGGGVVDRLRQLGHRVSEVNAGARAADERRYANLRAEMWARLREWIVHEGALPATDAGLADELSAPGYGFAARNRLQIESKDDMKSRGEASPDAADALALTFAYPVSDAPPVPRQQTALSDYDPFA